MAIIVHKGDWVTPNKPIPVYGHNYAVINDSGDLLDCHLMPGEFAQVVNPEAVSVRGRKPYFVFAQFEKDGRTHSLGLQRDEITQIRYGAEPV